MTVRPLLGLVMAGILVWNSAVTRPAVLGMVTEADRAHLNSLKVTAGATIFNGDRFSTEAGGVLFLRGGRAMLELAEESEGMVRSRPNGARGMEAEIGKGTVNFHVVGTDELEILAQGVHIRPATEAPTVGQVSVIGLKELRIYSRRGALQFSYRGETETIAEGAAYQVMLDPVQDAPEKNGPIKGARQQRTFLLVAIAGAAAGAAIAATMHGNHGHKKMESPDRP